MFCIHNENSMIRRFGEKPNDMCDRRIGMDVTRRIALFLLGSCLSNFGEVTQNVRVHRNLSFIYSSQLDVTRRGIANEHAILIHNSNAAQTLVIQQRESIRRFSSVDNADHILQIRQTGFVQSFGKILARDCAILNRF